VFVRHAPSYSSAAVAATGVAVKIDPSDWSA
jgi:hypothetical protein